VAGFLERPAGFQIFLGHDAVSPLVTRQLVEPCKRSFLFRAGQFANLSGAKISHAKLSMHFTADVPTVVFQYREHGHQHNDDGYSEAYSKACNKLFHFVSPF
jgi:hypothetical protein